MRTLIEHYRGRVSIVRTIQASTPVLLLAGYCAWAQPGPALESADVLKSRTEKIDYAAYFALNTTTGSAEKRPGFLASLDMDLARSATPTNAALIAHGVSGVLQLHDAKPDPPLLQQGLDVFSGLIDGLAVHTNGLPKAALDDIMPPLTTAALILRSADALSIEHLQSMHALGLKWQATSLGAPARPSSARGLISTLPLPYRSDYTWSLWLHTSATNAALLGALGRDRLGVTQAPALCLQDGRPALRIRDKTLAASSRVNDGHWHHLALVVTADDGDAAHLQLWVDGTAGPSHRIDDTFAHPPRRWGYVHALGTAPGIAPDFAGRLDDVRIYTAALAPETLATPAGLSTNALRAHWPLNAASDDDTYPDMKRRWPLQNFGVSPASASAAQRKTVAAFGDTRRAFLLPDPAFDLRTPLGAQRLETAANLGLLFDSDKDFAPSRARSDQHMRYIFDRGDTGLRDEPQASRALCTLINITRRLDRTQSLTAMAPVFERLHADTLPNASLPHPLRPTQLRWTYALETAAHVFERDAFAYSAQKHFLAFHSFHNMYPALPGGTPIYITARETHLTAGLAAFSPTEMSDDLTVLKDPSGITREQAWKANGDFASLVLRTGHAPGHAAIGMSLSPGRDSAHAGQRSALQMFTYGGVSLHEPAPRGAVLGSEASQLWMQPIGISFPIRQREAEMLHAAPQNPINTAYAAAGFTWRSPSDAGRLERHYVLSDIDTDRVDSDVSARLSFSQYGTRQSSLVRRLILTREGYLVITDILSPGKDAQGLAAGQLWRIPEKSSWVRNGGNWLAYILDQPEPILDQSDEPGTRGALVHFGDSWDDLYVGQKDDILYSQRNLTQEPATFAMVCMPLLQGQQSPRVLARQLTIRVSGERAGVTLPDGLSITSSPDKWTVTRTAPAP